MHAPRHLAFTLLVALTTLDACVNTLYLADETPGGDAGPDQRGTDTTSAPACNDPKGVTLGPCCAPGDPQCPAAKVSALTAGWYHTCALAAGTVYCWGDNQALQIGDGDVQTPSRTAPAQVSGLRSVQSVEAGAYHNCALVNNQAYCWGANWFGAVGDGTLSDRATPVPITLPAPAIALALGHHFSCALLDRDGDTSSGEEVWCWGINEHGELGAASSDACPDDQGQRRSCALQPQRAALDALGALTIRSLAAYGDFACIATAAGAVYCWGTNEFGTLGDGDASGVSSVAPVLPTALDTGVSAIVGGGHHACAIKDGALLCWGANWYGQQGTGAWGGPRRQPGPVTGIVSPRSVHSGYEHLCAIDGNGDVSCWGRNDKNQISAQASANCDGMPCEPQPLRVETLSCDQATQVAGGWYHTCALSSTGCVRCRGDGAFGKPTTAP
jgi:alpha-tubulin suppressor-like RCC1 family protein